MTIVEIRRRLAEIRNLLESDAEGIDIDALNAELDSLDEQRSAIESRQALVERVSAGGPEFRMIHAFGNDAPAEESRAELGADSAEYRAAFYRNLAHDERTGAWGLGEMSEAERRAWTHTTENTPNVIPVHTMTRIWDMVSEQYALLGRIAVDNIAGVFEFVQHTATENPAKVVTENAANEDQKLIFAKVVLAGQEIKAHVKLSARMRFQSIDGFEDYLVRHLSDQLGREMNRIVIAAIKATAVTANKFVTASGLTDMDIKKANGLLKGGVRHDVFANNGVIWNYIANVKNADGDEKFIEASTTDDPAVQGRIYGGEVVRDDMIGALELLIGDPATVVANMNQSPTIASDLNVETFETTHGALGFFDASLGDTRSWAVVTITPVV